MMAHETRAHALLSASSAVKWLNCPPSARLEEEFPDTKSEYAAEGTLAHEICELKLRKALIEPITPAKFKKAMKKLQEKELYQEEMQGYTDRYIDHTQSIVHGFSAPPYIAAEKRINYSDYAQEGFGTVDCLIIGGNEMHVIDFKYGKGVPVKAESNSQMLLYALGAYAEYSFLYPIKDVILTIVQPRLEDGISEWKITSQALEIWGESIKNVALLAYAGEGEFKQGDHCRFCKAKSLCRARADFNIEIDPEKGKLPPLITDEEVGGLLIRARDIAKWVSDLESYALSACLAGREVPGWKAVEGRSLRQFTDTDEAFDTLIKAHAVEEALLYERKPLSLAAIEKIIGKTKLYEAAGCLIVSPPGKPALALETDRREAITNRTSPEEAFGEQV